MNLQIVPQEIEFLGDWAFVPYLISLSLSLKQGEAWGV